MLCRSFVNRLSANDPCSLAKVFLSSYMCHKHKNKSKISSSGQTGMKYLSFYFVDTQISPVYKLQTRLHDI